MSKIEITDLNNTYLEKNTVTVIKSSSGQGKTTLALKVAFFFTEKESGS